MLSGAHVCTVLAPLALGPGSLCASVAAVFGSLVLALMLSSSPATAAHLAAALEGQPARVGGYLERVCWRESRCTAIDVHEIDEHGSRRGWVGQVKLGHLDPECQPYRPGEWATRGAFGLAAASHWNYLPPCYQPQILDIPMVSALVSARKWKARCERPRRARPGWCRVGRRRR